MALTKCTYERYTDIFSGILHGMHNCGYTGNAAFMYTFAIMEKQYARPYIDKDTTNEDKRKFTAFMVKYDEVVNLCSGKIYVNENTDTFYTHDNNNKLIEELQDMVSFLNNLPKLKPFDIGPIQ